MAMSIRTTGAVLLAAVALMGCEPVASSSDEMQTLDVIDSTNLANVMLAGNDPEASVDFFRSSLTEDPDRVEFQRGYAISLTRAGRHEEAAIAFERLDEAGDLTPVDRLRYAESLIRLNAWDRAEAQLSLIPNARDNYRWNLLNALIADSYENWDEADRFYAAARGLTSSPGPILNNWGISKMSRNDLEGAERNFAESIRFDSTLFEAKNNLAIARALQGNYAVPAVSLTEVERAQIYHNMALVALRQDETDTARGLLELAVETHPQFFPAASDKLAGLDGSVDR